MKFNENCPKGLRDMEQTWNSRVNPSELVSSYKERVNGMDELIAAVPCYGVNVV